MKVLLNIIFLAAFTSESVIAKSPKKQEELEQAFSQGASLMQEGKSTEALPYFKQALAIQEKSLGSENQDTVALLGVLGKTYLSIGDYTNAVSVNERALKIAEKNFGSNNPNTARILNNLGDTHLAKGDFSNAVPLLERALAILEKSTDREDLPATANVLDSLAETYRTMGRYEKALPLFERSLAMREKTGGNDDRNLAVELGHLADIYVDLGDYSKALLLQERSLSINEKTCGIDHPNTALSLNGLAVVYLCMENYEKGIPLLERALAIQEKKLGPVHLQTADTLGSLATAYHNTDNYEKSLPLFERTLSIREKVSGTDHPSTASALSALAVNYKTIKNYAKALPLFERALSIQEKNLGPEHPETAYSLCGLAATYQAMGNFEKALPLFERASTIQEKNLGEYHSDTLESRLSISKLQYLKASELPVIRETLSKVYSGNEKQMDQILTMDECTRLSWQKVNLQNDMIDLLPAEQRAQFIIRTKGVVLDSLMEDRATMNRLGDNNPDKKEVQLARFRIGKIAFSSKKEDQEEVSKLKERIDSILKTAAGQRAKVGRVRQAATITSDSVATTLPPGGILVEFIQFTDPKIKGDAGRCYGALILGRDGEPKFVRIDDAFGIDSSVRALRNAIAQSDEKALADQQKILSEKLWAPIAKILPEGTKKLFIGADGQLNFLSFAALPAQDGSFLGEHYEIAYVGSGRDLARKVSASDSKTITLFADPVFDLQSSTYSTNALALRSGELDEFGKIVLPPLPGTRAEEAVVEETAKSFGWSPDAHLGEKAAKSDLMALKSPGILHLATHGFYLNTLPQNGGGEGTERGMKLKESLDSKKPASPPKIDPMHASGIALTGAQATLKAWGEGRVPDSKEDGILTAEEVAGLNLDGTWLVTLSACETGVGEARSGEGVFGLRRAFMIAGAQNLLMTLWPVSDEVTPKIMAEFYKEALATHDAAGSLAKVQRDWLVKLRKEKGLLAAVRDAGPFAMVVMAKQDSTFSSPPNATPIASPQIPANSPGPAVSPGSIPVPAPSLPEQAAPNPSPAREVSPSATPSTSPSPTPIPDASPSSSPVLSEQAPLKKAA